VKQLSIVKICDRLLFVAVFVRACVFAAPCSTFLSIFLPGKSWSLILLNNIFCLVANCVLEAWLKNMQRIFRLVVVDGILHTQFICHACMSVSERAVVYLFHPLSPARCIWRNKFIKNYFISWVSLTNHDWSLRHWCGYLKCMSYILQYFVIQN